MLIANTSGPLGNVPLPPNVVFVSSWIALSANVDLSPGWATNEKIL